MFVDILSSAMSRAAAAIIAIMGWLSSCASASTPTTLSLPPSDKPIRVLFFSALRDTEGTWQQKADAHVPYLPGRSGYGWIAEMPTSNEVAITETLSLPEPARIWPPQMIVTENGRVGTATRRQIPANNYIYGFWAVAEGDPPGDYDLMVSLNGFEHRYHFRVDFQGRTTAVQRLPVVVN